MGEEQDKDPILKTDYIFLLWGDNDTGKYLRSQAREEDSSES